MTREMVLLAATVVDGDRDVPVRSDAGVLVRDDRIETIGGRQELLAAHPAATVIEFAAATLLPGLIDCHCHLTQRGDGSTYEMAARASREQRHRVATANARAHLEGGVTTLRDLGSHADLFEWRDAIATPMPRLVLYGRPLTPHGGHMHLFGGECSGPAEVAERARENLAMGSDGIKIVASGGTTIGTQPHVPCYSTPELTAAADVAHEQGRVITAHALPVEAMRQVLDARIDGIEHLGFLTGPGRSEFDLELAEELRDAGVTFGSTLGVNSDYVGMAERDEVSDYELVDQRNRSEYYVENARRLNEVGARIVAASDAGWKYTPFGQFATELRLLAAAGFGPLDVIDAATSRSATYLQLGDVGRLTPGFVADILVVNGDASRDVGALSSVRAVYRAGRLVVGAEPDRR